MTLSTQDPEADPQLPWGLTFKAMPLRVILSPPPFSEHLYGETGGGGVENEVLNLKLCVPPTLPFLHIWARVCLLKGKSGHIVFY